ncbi:MAG: nucleotidyltransferase family protein [Gemmiger formicilis]|uniref:nucleotidyltransferase family protein n=1 Tax=Gemmiger formicilis TaxID=745368 RepID=UPI002E7860F6|nr:nucleotidyltransferase family protein [Gemmiger formicilis]MEE1512002.1 nucleotidyltransferase family protein [Gemmiger formicilis]
MDFTGIIAEYDPFHNGHAAQLAAVRAAGAQCIAVCMSSGAVQRGGVPILPESVRVRAALDAGADLVVALPAPYACATAEQFAAAGVHLLAALGCDTLAFGAETPDAAALLDTASLLDGEELNARIRQNLATGMTYAAARAAAADTLHPGTGGLLRTPNNILGIEYCKAILHRHAALTPLALPRLGAAHGGGAGAHAGTPMASASFLRGMPQPDWEPFVPARAAELYGRAAADGLLLDGARLETAVLALLRMQDPANFAQVRGVREGLENRLTAAVREADSLDDLYTRLKTKRYPHARLRRLVLDAALGFPAELPMPPYLHVLGARKAALPRLKQASLPAATALADLARTGPEAAKISRLHNKAVDFSSLCREKIQPMGLAFTAKPVVI